jgi:hypothetical protein
MSIDNEEQIYQKNKEIENKWGFLKTQNFVRTFVKNVRFNLPSFRFKLMTKALFHLIGDSACNLIYTDD